MASLKYIRRKEQEEDFRRLLKQEILKTVSNFKTKEHPGMRANQRMTMLVLHEIMGNNL